MSAHGLMKIHELFADRIRLAIMATLVGSNEAVDFSYLVSTLEVTRGNLSSHVQKLEQAALIKVEKEFVDKKPRTSYQCTAKGLKEFEFYLAQVEKLLKGSKATKIK